MKQDPVLNFMQYEYRVFCPVILFKSCSSETKCLSFVEVLVTLSG